MATQVSGDALSSPLNPTQVSIVNRHLEVPSLKKAKAVKQIGPIFGNIPKEERQCVDGGLKVQATIVGMGCVSVAGAGGLGAASFLFPPLGIFVISWLGLMALIEGSRRINYNVKNILKSEEYAQFRTNLITAQRKELYQEIINADDILCDFRCPMSRELPSFPVNDTPPSDHNYKYRMTYEYTEVVKWMENHPNQPFYRGEKPFHQDRLYFDYFHSTTIVMRLSKIISCVSRKISINPMSPDPRDQRINFPDSNSHQPIDREKREDIRQISDDLTKKRTSVKTKLEKVKSNPSYLPGQEESDKKEREALPTWVLLTSPECRSDMDVYEEFALNKPAEEELKERLADFEHVTESLPKMEEEQVKERNNEKAREEREREMKDLYEIYSKNGCFAKTIDRRDGCCGDTWRTMQHRKPRILCRADLISAKEVRKLLS